MKSSPGVTTQTWRWGYATIYTDDCAGDIQSACTLTHDENTPGRINYHAAEDIDWYRVILTGNTTYTIDVKGKSTGDGTLVDPRVRLYELDGTAISGQQNNDGGAGRNTRQLRRLLCRRVGEHRRRTRQLHGVGNGGLIGLGRWKTPTARLP